jgi:phage terminase large subunit-like protein
MVRRATTDALADAIRRAFVEKGPPEAKHSAEEIARYDWRRHARSTQLPPDSWLAGRTPHWLYRGGRGVGKTRCGAETTRRIAEAADTEHIIMAGPTAADVRDVMVEGESGILAVSPDWCRPHYEPSKRRLTWPSGVRAVLVSADEPDRFRGLQCGFAWADELAAWKRPEAWDMLLMGLRLGNNPRTIVTTTPRPTTIIRALVKAATTVQTVESTHANRANLAEGFFEAIIAKYEGTRLGRQELDAEILEDVDGALWNWEAIEACRVDAAPTLVRIVVAIDPAVTAGEDSDETGIVVVGRAADGHCYVLDDGSGRLHPAEWARRSLALLATREGDCIVAEVNNGGDMVEHTIRVQDRAAPVRQVRASRGKQTRAEPVALRYERGEVHHVGVFPALEEQLCTWVPGERSPDRLDALVWGVAELTKGTVDLEAVRRAQDKAPRYTEVPAALDKWG